MLLESLRDEQQNPVVYDSELADVIGHEVEDASVAEPMGEGGRPCSMRRRAAGESPHRHHAGRRQSARAGRAAAPQAGFTRTTIATYVMRERATRRLKLPEYWTETPDGALVKEIDR